MGNEGGISFLVNGSKSSTSLSEEEEDGANETFRNGATKKNTISAFWRSLPAALQLWSSGLSGM